MKRVTPEDIIEINEAYLICKTYSGTAKATGWSASTVAKYIIPDYKSQLEQNDVLNDVEPAPIEEAMNYLLSHSNLSSLTDQEKKDMKEIWKGMLI